MNKEMKFSKSLARGIILAERRQRVSRPVFSLSVCCSRSIFLPLHNHKPPEGHGGGGGLLEEGDGDEVPLRILLQGLLSLLNSLLRA